MMKDSSLMQMCEHPYLNDLNDLNDINSLNNLNNLNDAASFGEELARSPGHSMKL